MLTGRVCSLIAAFVLSCQVGCAGTKKAEETNRLSEAEQAQFIEEMKKRPPPIEKLRVTNPSDSLDALLVVIPADATATERVGIRSPLKFVSRGTNELWS